MKHFEYIRHIPVTVGDRIAKQVTMMLRWVADTFFLKQYGQTNKDTVQLITSMQTKIYTNNLVWYIKFN